MCGLTFFISFYRFFYRFLILYIFLLKTIGENTVENYKQKSYRIFYRNEFFFCQGSFCSYKSFSRLPVLPCPPDKPPSYRHNPGAAITSPSTLREPAWRRDSVRSDPVVRGPPTAPRAVSLLMPGAVIDRPLSSVGAGGLRRVCQRRFDTSVQRRPRGTPQLPADGRRSTPPATAG